MKMEKDKNWNDRPSRNICRGNIYWLVMPLVILTFLRAIVNENGLTTLESFDNSSETGLTRYRGHYARPKPVFDPSTIPTPAQLRARKQEYIAMLKKVPPNIT